MEVGLRFYFFFPLFLCFPTFSFFPWGWVFFLSFATNQIGTPLLESATLRLTKNDVNLGTLLFMPSMRSLDAKRTTITLRTTTGYAHIDLSLGGTWTPPLTTLGPDCEDPSRAAGRTLYHPLEPLDESPESTVSSQNITTD